MASAGDDRSPWRSERELDAAIALQAIARCFPELAAREARYLHAGWDSEAFLVDEEWVFRFPKRAGVVPHIQSEIAVLPILAPRLPLPIPDVRFAGAPGPEFPFPFMGYRKLPGTPADQLTRDSVDVAAVLDSVIELLGCLHGQPIEGPIARVAGHPWPALGHTIDTARRVGVAGHEQGARAIAWLESSRSDEASFARVLTHDDLGAEHILVDPATSRVTGVIDWGDMNLGDAATDFAGLIFWAGLAAVTAAFERSRYPAGADLLARAHRRAIHGTLIWWCSCAEFDHAIDPEQCAAAMRRLLDAS